MLFGDIVRQKVLLMGLNFPKNHAMLPQLSERWLIIGSFFVTYFVWGSTYLVNYLAIQGIPPFLMSGSRFFTAGLLLYLYARLRGIGGPTMREALQAAGMGILFLSIGTGGVVWAEQYIDTGLAALLVTFDPLLIMLLMWLLLGSKPAWISIAGAAVGIAGMGLLIDQPQLLGSQQAVTGLVVIALSLLSWAIASIYVSRVAMPSSRLHSSAWQMLGGGFTLLLFSWLTGEASTFSAAAVTPKVAYAWIYLVVLGSLLAFSCFNYLLTKVSPEKVATNTYVNPIVAMFLGWAFNGEEISSRSVIAGLLMLTGVFFINIRR